MWPAPWIVLLTLVSPPPKAPIVLFGLLDIVIVPPPVKVVLCALTFSWVWEAAPFRRIVPVLFTVPSNTAPFPSGIWKVPALVTILVLPSRAGALKPLKFELMVPPPLVVTVPPLIVMD